MYTETTPKVQIIACAAKDHVYPGRFVSNWYVEFENVLVYIPEASTQILMNQGSANAAS